MERWESRASVPFPAASTWLLLAAGLPVIAGYAGLAVLLFLPLLVMRRLVPRPATIGRAAV